MALQQDSSVATSARLASALPSSMRLMASALGGDRNALERLAAYPKLNDEIARQGVGSALARSAERTGIAGSCVEHWHSTRLGNLNKNAIRMQAQGNLAKAFAALDIRWAPLNGPPLFSAIFPEQDDRPPSNIKILLAGNVNAARQACVRLGWNELHQSPGLDRYFEDEGWMWRGQQSDGLQLDLHYRFGPWAPENMFHSVTASFNPDADLGQTGFRPGIVEAYILTAVRLALDNSPRSLLHWWDLQMIVENGDSKIGERIHQRARENGLHILVGFVAAVAAGLWGHESNYFIAKLIKTPPRGESIALKLASSLGPHRIPANVLLLARLIDGRQSHLGWKALSQHFWRHQDLVGYQTPENWPWPLRRLFHLARSATIGTPRPFGEKF